MDWPPLGDYKADVSSFSPSSERSLKTSAGQFQQNAAVELPNGERNSRKSYHCGQWHEIIDAPAVNKT